MKKEIGNVTQERETHAKQTSTDAGPPLGFAAMQPAWACEVAMVDRLKRTGAGMKGTKRFEMLCQ